MLLLLMKYNFLKMQLLFVKFWQKIKLLKLLAPEFGHESDGKVEQNVGKDFRRNQTIEFYMALFSKFKQIVIILFFNI